MSPQAVASSRSPSPSRTLSRAAGSSAPTTAIRLPSSSGAASRYDARTAESHTDSARGQASAGSTDRSTTPLCDNDHPWRTKGAQALSSVGIPTVASRTAATTHPAATWAATEASDASDHIGPELRQRAGPGAEEASGGLHQLTPHPSALTVPCRCRRGAQLCCSNPCGRSSRNSDRFRGRPSQAVWRHTQALQASRRPVKICRRTGKSQFRKEGRTDTGSLAQEPPRSTR